jgi:hypothetical protein
MGGLMAVIVLALVFAIAVLALIVFVAVVVGIHSEAPYQMSTRPRGLLAAMVRRMLGVYVGKPADTDTGDHREECCLTGQSTDWWNKGGGDR